jgi:hypothetical protein
MPQDSRVQNAACTHTRRTTLRPRYDARADVRRGGPCNHIGVIPPEYELVSLRRRPLALISGKCAHELRGWRSDRLNHAKAVVYRQHLTRACCEARRWPPAREQSHTQQQENEPASTGTIAPLTREYRVQLKRSRRGQPTARGAKSRAPQNVRKLWHGPIWNRIDP